MIKLARKFNSLNEVKTSAFLSILNRDFFRLGLPVQDKTIPQVNSSIEPICEIYSMNLIMTK
jgi:hypothetical protein